MKRPRRQRYDKLNDRDILGFVHNAQLVLADRVTDQQIPLVYHYKLELSAALSDTTLTPYELAAALVSVAYDLVKGAKNGNKAPSA
jgi:hypothetical protein